jgi:hypothetical protein
MLSCFSCENTAEQQSMSEASAQLRFDLFMSKKFWVKINREEESFHVCVVVKVIRKRK